MKVFTTIIIVIGQDDSKIFSPPVSREIELGSKLDGKTVYFLCSSCI